jgi:UDP-N-acetylmuramate dehydrogenase
LELASASRSQYTTSVTIEEDIQLAPFTTFGIGGNARFFARATTLAELREALAFVKEKALKFFILGGGSNILVGDAGFDGLVIKIELAGVEEEGDTFIAAAGESWDALVERAVSKNLWGIENLSGIPGTVGGAVVQNIGAYGQALSEVLQSVEVFDTTEGVTKEFSNAQCHFGYRNSVFKIEPGRYIILRVALSLQKEARPKVSYKDLAARFKESTPTLSQLRAAVLEIRGNKFPNLKEEGTAGSFFKNPVVPLEDAHTLQAKYPELPVFSLPESEFIKIPLAWLFDHVLRMHGTQVGGARLYERQPLVIAAKKGTSSQDVIALAHLVEEKVKNEFNIAIEPEVYVI